MSSSSKGTLYLVPTPLDFGCDTQAPITDVLPQETLRIAASISHWVTENAKSTRAFLKRVDAQTPLAQAIQQNTITELPREVHKKGDHTGDFDAKPLLKAALAGHDVGLVSEAGMPAVADPGSSVVRAAHDLGIRVVPLVGPVSLLLALAATSFQRAIRALGGKRWQALHRTVYAAALLAVLHFFWMRAGKNNFAEVAVYAAIIAALLANLRSLVAPLLDGLMGKAPTSAQAETS